MIKNQDIIRPLPSEIGSAYTAVTQDTRLDILEGTAGAMGSGFTLSRGVVQTTAGSGDPSNYYPGVVYGPSGMTSYNSGGISVFTVSASTGTVNIDDSSGDNIVNFSGMGLQVQAGNGSGSSVSSAAQPWEIDWVVPGTGVVVGAISSSYNNTGITPPEDLITIGARPSTSGHTTTASVVACDSGGSVRAAVYATYNDSSGVGRIGLTAGGTDITIWDGSNTFLHGLHVANFTNLAGASSTGDIFASNSDNCSGALYHVGAVGAYTGFGNPSGINCQLRCNPGSLPGFPSNNYPTLMSSFTTLYFSVSGVYCAYLQATGILQQSSGKSLKQLFRNLDPDETLNRIKALPVQEWEHKQAPGDRHIGPTAEDFYSHFRLGQFRPRKEDRTRPHHEPMLAASDVAGVALLGVQGLVSRVKELERELHDVKHRMFLQEVG